MTFRSVARSCAAWLVLSTACAPARGTIGAVLAQRPDGRLFVHEAPEGLAADKAGLQEGDEILLVEGMDVRALAPKELHAALSGDVDSKVRLTVVRGEEVLRLTLKRTPAKRRKRSVPR